MGLKRSKGQVGLIIGALLTIGLTSCSPPLIAPELDQPQTAADHLGPEFATVEATVAASTTRYVGTVGTWSVFVARSSTATDAQYCVLIAADPSSALSQCATRLPVTITTADKTLSVMFAGGSGPPSGYEKLSESVYSWTT